MPTMMHKRLCATSAISKLLTKLTFAGATHDAKHMHGSQI